MDFSAAHEQRNFFSFGNCWWNRIPNELYNLLLDAEEQETLKRRLTCDSSAHIRGKANGVS